MQEAAGQARVALRKVRTAGLAWLGYARRCTLLSRLEVWRANVLYCTVRARGLSPQLITRFPGPDGRIRGGACDN